LKTEEKTEPVFVITDLKQGVKNENRVNVFVNNKYSFSLDISQVVDFHLKKGLEISEEQIEEYKRASEFGKLYQRRRYSDCGRRVWASYNQHLDATIRR
jgi:regulatory protein